MTSDAAETWHRALANFNELVSSVEDWSTESPCPGWTVQDLVSHTIDLESMLAGDPRPDHAPEWDTLSHIDSEFGQMTEVGVDFRRGLSREELLAELADSHLRARQRIKGVAPDATIPWLRGETPIPVLLGMRTFDIWVHEQDVRVAVGRPGNLTGPGSHNALQYLSAGLPKVWGKNVGAPIGSVLHVNVVVPGLCREEWIRIGDDGKATLSDPMEATASVTIPWPAFVMLGAGREPRESFVADVSVDGDQDLGWTFVHQMAVTP